MLSDEEKQAIKVLNHFNPVDCGREDTQAIETILNLIEKQSKEIEELKKENKEIRDWKYVIDNPIDLKKLSELDIIKIFGKSYIAKDKIKAKIEEIDKILERNLLVDRLRDYFKAQKEVLKSLLEKE